MGMVWMGKKKRNLSMVRKDSGQSVVEYILLLAVLTFIISVIFQSPMFRQWMGKDSLLFGELRRQMVYAYCNPLAAAPSSPESCAHDYGTLLESYNGRFFIPAEEYP